MTDEAQNSTPTLRGTADRIMARLWTFCLMETDSAEISRAIEQIAQGDRAVEVHGERFEVIEPGWSIVQDVYGCEHGRGCRDVTPAMRADFEAIITARLEAGG